MTVREEKSMQASVTFAENPAPRIPVVIVNDISGSMDGSPIEEANKGIQLFAKEIKKDDFVAASVEVAVITFGGKVQVHTPFTAADDFAPTYFKATGQTPMGEALELCLKLLGERRRLYKQHDLESYRPMVLVFTDGEPTDNWKSTAQKTKLLTSERKLFLYPIGVGKANLSILSQFSDTQTPIMLETVSQFSTLFQLFSDDLASVASSHPSAQYIPSISAAKFKHS